MGAVAATPPVQPGRIPDAHRALLAIAGGVTLLTLLLAAFAGKPLLALLMLIDVGLVAFLTHRFLLQWHVLAAAIVLCILLIPINRYEFLGNLPFNLEPYRLLVAAVSAGWLASLLAQQDTRWKSTGLFVPMLGVAVSILASIALNVGRLPEPGVQSSVIKNTTMFASFFVVMLYVSAVIQTRAQLYMIIKTMVAGGGIVAFFGLVQYRTGFNVFDHLDRAIPVLHVNGAGLVTHVEARGGGARVYASASHPIAFSAAMVMLVPIAFYVAKTFRGKRWWIFAGLILMAAMAAVARTGMLMLVTELITMLCLKPRTVIRLWPYALPFIVAIHFVAPEALGGLKSAFLPQGGLVAEQHESAGGVGSNRLADLGPSLASWSKEPGFGQGFGTRITDPMDPNTNAFILDDQWLSSLLEIGAVGVFSLLFLFVRVIRRTGRAARRDETDYGWLLASMTAAITGFAVGMLTFDAFAFFQVTFICFVMMGLAIPAARLATDSVRRPRRVAPHLVGSAR